MTWTAPMTAVTDTQFTAAQFNQHIRDNLKELAPAKAGTAGGYFVSTGANAIVERTVQQNEIATSQTTTSLTYTDLATVGPTVTVTTGTSAIIWIGARMSSNTIDAYCSTTVAVSGASSYDTVEQQGVDQDGVATANQSSRLFKCHRYWQLTPGSNTFTMKYRSNGTDTATFLDRTLIVMPM